MPEVSRFYGIVIKMFFDDHVPSNLVNPALTDSGSTVFLLASGSESSSGGAKPTLEAHVKLHPPAS